jgi:hypothetical protein
VEIRAGGFATGTAANEKQYQLKSKQRYCFEGCTAVLAILHNGDL